MSKFSKRMQIEGYIGKTVPLSEILCGSEEEMNIDLDTRLLSKTPDGWVCPGAPPRLIRITAMVEEMPCETFSARDKPR
jgi:hypothetical protein